MGVDSILAKQGGVISRAQVIAEDGDDNLIARKLRRREWATWQPGVYVAHTGPLSEDQEREAAVLAAWPAALSAETALIAHGMKNVPKPRSVQVAISADRRVERLERVEVTRMRRFREAVQWNRSPPRLRVEHALVLVASRRLRSSEADAVALLSDACQQGLTTADRLVAALDAHPRLPGRRFLRRLLADVAAGTYSLLEHRYLTRVERPHGLPTARRQQRFELDGKKGYRDVEYEEQRLLLELDGRLGHEWAADRWADYERDILAATEEQLTVRAGWAQLADPCRLARVMGRLLVVRGWTGEPRPCPAC